MTQISSKFKFTFSRFLSQGQVSNTDIGILGHYRDVETSFLSRCQQGYHAFCELGILYLEMVVLICENYKFLKKNQVNTGKPLLWNLVILATIWVFQVPGRLYFKSLHYVYMIIEYAIITQSVDRNFLNIEHLISHPIMQRLIPEFCIWVASCRNFLPKIFERSYINNIKNLSE